MIRTADWRTTKDPAGECVVIARDVGPVGETVERESWFPLQRRCTLSDVANQAQFAQDAVALIATDETANLRATADGLVLLAQNQIAHRRLIELIESVYGNRVEFGPLEIRYRDEHGVRREPYMAVRIECQAERHDTVVADLRWRDAQLHEARCDADRGVIRATVPLALLLGYPSLLSRLDPSATLTSWLAFYARVGGRVPRIER